MYKLHLRIREWTRFKIGLISISVVESIPCSLVQTTTENFTLSNSESAFTPHLLRESHSSYSSVVRESGRPEALVGHRQLHGVQGVEPADQHRLQRARGAPRDSLPFGGLFRPDGACQEAEEDGPRLGIVRLLNVRLVVSVSKLWNFYEMHRTH